MARPPALPVEDKLHIVLSILAGESTIAAAARKHGLSEQTIGNWKKQFIQGGREGLSGTARTERASARETALKAEIDNLRAALDEVRVQLRVWMNSEEQAFPSRTLR
ncbi:transposase [Kitasatospora sp. NPDC088346]|uniref:transposase n=1 Tax=Kitasatospora sp. NPDC088346 TaxID=3364073 RepID=UPI0037F19B12